MRGRRKNEKEGDLRLGEGVPMVRQPVCEDQLVNWRKGSRASIPFSDTLTRRLLGLGTKSQCVPALRSSFLSSLSYLLSHTSSSLPTFTHSLIPLSAPSQITMTADLHFLTPEQKQKVI